MLLCSGAVASTKHSSHVSLSASWLARSVWTISSLYLLQANICISVLQEGSALAEDRPRIGREPVRDQPAILSGCICRSQVNQDATAAGSCPRGICVSLNAIPRYQQMNMLKTRAVKEMLVSITKARPNIAVT